jgi:hypothetical protein
MKPPFELLASFCLSLLLGACGGNYSTEPGHVTTQPVPNSDQCYFFIPYDARNFSGNVGGSISATGLPGANAGISGGKNWGYLTYIGKCNDPQHATKVEIPTPAKSDGSTSGATKTPTASPGTAAATKPKGKKGAQKIAVTTDPKLNQIGAAIVSGNGTPKGNALLSQAIPLYQAINQFAQLKPVAKDQPPASKIISALASSVPRGFGGEGVPSRVPATKQAINQKVKELTQ